MLWFSYVYNMKMRRAFRKNKEKIAEVNAKIQDSLSGIRVVKSFANEAVGKEKFKEGNIEYLQTKEDSYFIMGTFYSGNSLFQGILYLTVVF